MKIDRVVGTLVSGIAVYLLMAACSATSDGGKSGLTGPNAPPTNTTSSSGTSAQTSGSSSSSGIVPNAMADQWWAAGSRLKLRYVSASDGTKQFVTWFDSVIGEECAFQLYADGKQHCLPRAMPALDVIYFDTPNCTGNTLVSINPPTVHYATTDASKAYGTANGTGVYLYKLTSLTKVAGSTATFSRLVLAKGCEAAQEGMSLYPATEFTNTVDATIETTP